MPTIMLCDPQLSCRNMLTTEGQTGRSCCGRVDVRDTNPAANGMQPSTNAAGARLNMLLWMLGTDRDCKPVSSSCSQPQNYWMSQNKGIRPIGRRTLCRKR